MGQAALYQTGAVCYWLIGKFQAKKERIFDSQDALFFRLIIFCILFQVKLLIVLSCVSSIACNISDPMGYYLSGLRVFIVDFSVIPKFYG